MAPPGAVRGGHGCHRPAPQPHRLPAPPSSSPSPALAAASRGPHGGGIPRLPPVCRFWLQGRCTRRPCPFLHRGDHSPPASSGPKKMVEQTQLRHLPGPRSHVWRNPGLGGGTVRNADSSQPRSPPATHGDVHGGLGDSENGIILPSGNGLSRPSTPVEGVRDGEGNAISFGGRDDHSKQNDDGAIVSGSSNADGKNIPFLGDEPSCSSLPITGVGDGNSKNDTVPCGDLDMFDREDPSRPSSPATAGKDDQGSSSHSTSEEMICRTAWFSSSSVMMIGIGGVGYQKAVTGIALPSGYHRLFSGCADGRICILDCHSRRCVQTIDLGSPVACVITQGPWVFAGVRGAVKCCNVQTQGGLSLPGPTGQVCSLVASNEVVFVGVEDGSILAWKMVLDDADEEKSYCFRPAITMGGHKSAVISLAMRHGHLYSGSMDGTITAWSLETLKCTCTVSGHSDVVTSLLCWEEFLLSCSLDGSIMVWAFIGEKDSGDLKVVYTHREEHEVLLMSSAEDSEGRPAVVCSRDNGIVQMYELPSFRSMGVISSRAQVWAIHPSAGGIFFTGDTLGEIKVWRCKGGRQGS